MIWLILLLVLLVIVEIAVTVMVAAQVGLVFLFFTVVVTLVVAGVWLLSRQTPLPPDSESSEWQPKPKARDPHRS